MDNITLYHFCNVPSEHASHQFCLRDGILTFTPRVAFHHREVQAAERLFQALLAQEFDGWTYTPGGYFSPGRANFHLELARAEKKPEALLDELGEDAQEEVQEGEKLINAGKLTAAIFLKQMITHCTDHECPYVGYKSGNFVRLPNTRGENRKPYLVLRILYAKSCKKQQEHQQLFRQPVKATRSNDKELGLRADAVKQSLPELAKSVHSDCHETRAEKWAAHEKEVQNLLQHDQQPTPVSDIEQKLESPKSDS